MAIEDAAGRLARWRRERRRGRRRARRAARRARLLRRLSSSRRRARRAMPFARCSCATCSRSALLYLEILLVGRPEQGLVAQGAAAVPRPRDAHLQARQAGRGLPALRTRSSRCRRCTKVLFFVFLLTILGRAIFAAEQGDGPSATSSARCARRRRRRRRLRGRRSARSPRPSGSVTRRRPQAGDVTPTTPPASASA